MNYEKPEIYFLMLMGDDIITSSLDILEKDPINGGGDIEYDGDGE